MPRPRRLPVSLPLAVFIAGFVTYAQLYAPQTVLPIIGEVEGLSPATTSGMISAVTLGVAISVVPWSLVAIRLGHSRLLRLSLIAASVLALVAPLLPTWPLIVTARFLSGVALGALPAIAVTFIADSVTPVRVPALVGLLITGNTMGGLAGRLASAALAENIGWRGALVGCSLVCLAFAIVFQLVVPTSPRPAPRTSVSVLLRHVAAQVRKDFATSRLWLLCVQSFLLLGAFITMYTYIPHRLVGEPFALSATLASAAFVVYLTGIAAGGVAARLLARWSNRRVLAIGGGLMLAGVAGVATSWLVVVVIGLAVFSFGYFVSSTATTSWVPFEATHARGQAAAFVQLGGFIGTAALAAPVGLIYQAAGWNALVAAEAGLVVLAIVLLVSAGRPRRSGTPGTSLR